MKKIFEEINFEELKTGKSIAPPPFNSRTNFSVFPLNTDTLKDISIEDTSIASINADLNRYYILLLEYLKQNSLTVDEKGELKNLITKLSKFNLTGYDYNVLRDSILELFNYLNVVDSQFTSDTGVYIALQKSAEAFAIKLNTLINSINSKYGNLVSDPVLGGIFPNGSINESYLEDGLKAKISAVEGLNGFILVVGDDQAVQDFDLSGFAIKPLIFGDEGIYV